MSLAALVMAPLLNNVSLELPSIDGLRGAAAQYERYVPFLHMSVAVGGETRESATGDYTALRLGTLLQLRCYFHNSGGAWLSRLPAGNMDGWFFGSSIELATDSTHDDADHRWLGTTLSIGGISEVGYRIVPWRELAITPHMGVSLHEDIDLRGHVPAELRPGFVYGVDVGWLF